MPPTAARRARLAAAASTRSDTRSRLRLARHGDLDAFLSIAERYFDLVAEMLALAGHGSPGKRRETALEVFLSIWKVLPQARRVADLERMLAARLIALAPTADWQPEGLVGSLANLSPEARFALVAREMEDWPRRSLRLSLRLTDAAVDRLLLSARCELVGTRFDLMEGRIRRVITQVHRGFEEQLADSAQRRLTAALAKEPAARDFKAGWLACRCELIELRQQIRWDRSDRNRLLEQLAGSARETRRERVSLLGQLVNGLSFSRLPERA
jgi:hypothetical protein